MHDNAALVTKLFKSSTKQNFYGEAGAWPSFTCVVTHIPSLLYNQSTPPCYQHGVLKHLLWLIWLSSLAGVQDALLPRPHLSILSTTSVIQSNKKAVELL